MFSKSKVSGGNGESNFLFARQSRNLYQGSLSSMGMGWGNVY